MTQPPPAPGPRLSPLPGGFALAAAAVVLVLLPPETRPEAWLAAPALLSAALATAWLQGTVPCWGLGLLASLPAGLWALVQLSRAPGASVGAGLLWAGALVAGLAASGLRKAHGSSPWHAWQATLSVLASLAGAYAVYQVFWGLERDLAATGAMEGLPHAEAVVRRLAEGRAFGFFATPAALGGFLALSLPLTVAWALRTPRSRLVWVGMALQVGGLVSAASVTAAAGLVAASAAVLVARGGSGLRRFLWLGAATVAAAVVAVRWESLFDLARWDHPLWLRLGNLRAAWSMALDHAGLGVGLGAFGEVFPAYRAPGMNEIRHAHDLPLEVLAELGLLLGGALVCLWIGAARRALGAPRSPRRLSWSAGVGLLALGLQNLLDFTLFMPSILWLAALTWGLAPRAEDSAAVHGRPKETRPDGTSPPAVGVWLAAALAVAVWMGLGAAHGRAEMAREAALGEAAAGRTRAALHLLNLAARWAPWSPDVLVARLQVAGTLPEGLRPETETLLSWADAAVRWSPVRPGARFERSRWRLAAGDLPGAWADAREASRLYPMEPRYREWAKRLREKLPRRARASAGPPTPRRTER